MIFIDKHGEPVWLGEFKRKNSNATYDSEKFRPHIRQLNEELIAEQRGVCAYCCCTIDSKNSHNEHIEPRHPGTYVSNRTLDYDNIVASCNGFHGDFTCGNRKGNTYDMNKFISPLSFECEETFVYFPNGVMEGSDYTIGLLNLNSYRLKEARKSIYNEICVMDEKDIYLVFDESGDNLPAFINVVRWYVKNELHQR